MKTTKEIEADFGLNETESRLLVCVVTGLPIPGNIHHDEMQTMIKALYRRIEALEIQTGNTQHWLDVFQGVSAAGILVASAAQALIQEVQSYQSRTGDQMSDMQNQNLSQAIESLELVLKSFKKSSREAGMNWCEDFRKFRVAVRQALFECGVMSNPGSNDSDLTTAIVQLGKDKKSLLENCVIMQSRVAAILDVPNAIEGLCAEDVFGAQYKELLEADNSALKLAIIAAGGQVKNPILEGDNG